MRENRTYGLMRGLQGKESALLCTLLYWFCGKRSSFFTTDKKKRPTLQYGL